MKINVENSIHCTLTIEELNIIINGLGMLEKEQDPTGMYDLLSNLYRKLNYDITYQDELLGRRYHINE